MHALVVVPYAIVRPDAVAAEADEAVVEREAVHVQITSTLLILYSQDDMYM